MLKLIILYLLLYFKMNYGLDEGSLIFSIMRKIKINRNSILVTIVQNNNHFCRLI